MRSITKHIRLSGHGSFRSMGVVAKPAFRAAEHGVRAPVLKSEEEYEAEKKEEEFVKAAGSEAHHRIEVVEDLIKDVTGHKKTTDEAFAELAAPEFDPVVPDVENAEKTATERAIQQLEMEVESKILISGSEAESEKEKETETEKEEKMKKEEKAPDLSTVEINIPDFEAEAHVEKLETVADKAAKITEIKRDPSHLQFIRKLHY